MFGKNLELSPMESLFILVIHKIPSVSGSKIVEAIDRDLGAEWKPTAGATYKILKSLEVKGMIVETTPSLQQREDQRLRTYSLTENGEKMLPVINSRFKKVIVFMGNCCSDCCPELKDVIHLFQKEDCKDPKE